MPRLTKEQRSNVVRDYRAGVSLPEIKAKYGVSIYYPIRLARKAGVPRRQSESVDGRKSRRRWDAKNKEKRAAHKAVEYALNRGDLKKKPCEKCGDADAHAHHEDYSRPLDVKWLCPKDHKARHREMDRAGIQP